jgi:murein DD-endopeptidase MepM/ murein hydrolase activator NlpD
MRAACLVIGIAWAASAGGEELYRLPWPDGLSFMFTQVPGGRITTHFTKSTLNAVDIAMPVGIPVLAARAGVVESLESRHGASDAEEPLTYEGNFVRVRHEDGSVAIYAHLARDSAVVLAGQAVIPGQLLAYSGFSGDAAEPHLHFAVLQEDASVPMKFYVGAPPVTFSARAALRVTASYSGAVRPPRTPREAEPMVPWRRAPLEPVDEASGWRLLATWCACGIAAFALFWKFSRG